MYSAVAQYCFCYAFATGQCRRSKALCFRAVRPSAEFVCSFVQILSPRYLMNSLSSLDETYKEYSLAPTDDLIRFWRTKVKVTPGRRGGNGSTSTLGRPSVGKRFPHFSTKLRQRHHGCLILTLSWKCVDGPALLSSSSSSSRLLKRLTNATIIQIRKK